MLKLSDNPPIVSNEMVALCEMQGTWRIAYTKARFEKAFAWDLLNLGIDYFLPMREKVGFSGGRKRKVLVPLFTSYVFVCGTEVDRYRALTTNRISSLIDVFDQHKLVEQLSFIHKALADKIVVDSYPHLAVGTRCRVNKGPLMGTEGVVIKKDKLKARMVLEVTMLGQGAVVEVDSDLLEVVG